MAYHQFKAIARPGFQALPEGYEVSFVRYFGIGTFPERTSDRAFRKDILISLKGSLTDDALAQVEEAWQNGRVLFDVVDETVMHQRAEEDRIHVVKRREKQVKPKEQHSAYYYIFVRPVQIILVLLFVGYVLYLFARSEYQSMTDFDDRRHTEQPVEDDYFE